MKTLTLLVRPDLALCLPGLRASAAGAGRLLLRGRLPAGALRRPAGPLGPARPGRDRAQARLDLPPGGLARAPAGHPDGHAGAAPLQPAGAAAPGPGQRAGRRAAEPARGGTADAPCLARRCRCQRPRAAARAARGGGTAARPGQRAGQGRTARPHRGGHRTRHLRRAHASNSTAGCSGAWTRCRCCARRCRATRGSTARPGTRRRWRRLGWCAAAELSRACRGPCPCRGPCRAGRRSAVRYQSSCTKYTGRPQAS